MTTAEEAVNDKGLGAYFVRSLNVIDDVLWYTWVDSCTIVLHGERSSAMNCFPQSSGPVSELAGQTALQTLLPRWPKCMSRLPEILSRIRYLVAEARLRRAERHPILCQRR